MFDTLKIQMPGPAPDDAFLDWLRERFQNVRASEQFHDANKPWQGVQWEDPAIGAMGIKSSKLGCFLWAERSLPKLLHGDNCRVLSSAEALEAAALLRDTLIGLFAPWSPWTPATMLEQCQVKRLDLCYQKRVPCAQEVFPALYAGLDLRRSTKHGLQTAPGQLYLTGCTFRQNKQESARWYEKGVESGNESYHDVIRHEEQLRGGKAGYFLDLTEAQPVARIAEARERMNSRYEGWGSNVAGYDLAEVLTEHGTTGLAATALVVRPDLEPLARRCLPKSTFYRVWNVALIARRRQFVTDLTLPADAWAEPMVL